MTRRESLTPQASTPHEVRPRVRYLALIHSVHEVSLTGTADVDYWRRRLDLEDLEPVCDAHGSAQVWVGAADMKFQFQRFREVSVAVAARVPGEVDDGFFLLHAFNTNRWFAWCERHIFSTPFTRAECRVTDEVPLGIGVVGESKPILSAVMASGERLRAGAATQADWEGRVHLPSRLTGGPRRFFYALTSGHGHVWEFRPEDSFQLDPLNGPPAFQWLADSGFMPHHWMCRHHATHGKSRTHRRH